MDVRDLETRSIPPKNITALDIKTTGKSVVCFFAVEATRTCFGGGPLLSSTSAWFRR